MDLHIGMHIFEHKIYRIHQEVGDELVWVRALQYPEINRLAAPESHQNQFKKRLIEISEANSIESFGQRVFNSISGCSSVASWTRNLWASCERRFEAH